MRHSTYKYIRQMVVRETPQGRGQLTEIAIRCDDNGQWQVNGVPVPNDASMGLAMAHVVNALATERGNRVARRVAAAAVAAAPVVAGAVRARRQ